LNGKVHSASYKAHAAQHCWIGHLAAEEPAAKAPLPSPTSPEATLLIETQSIWRMASTHVAGSSEMILPGIEESTLISPRTLKEIESRKLNVTSLPHIRQFMEI